MKVFFCLPGFTKDLREDSKEKKKMVVLVAKKAEQQLNEPNKTKSNIKQAPETKKKKVGRKSVYDWKVAPKLHLIADWARNGVLENEIYKKLGISHESFYRYKRQHRELVDALKTREEADSQVEAALFKNATGFFYDEVQTIERYSDKEGMVTETKIIKKYKEPDTTAQAIWLNNRRREVWRQKQEQLAAGESTEIREFIVSVKEAAKEDTKKDEAANAKVQLNEEDDL